MKSSEIKMLLENHGIEWFAVNEYVEDWPEDNESWTLSQVENEMSVHGLKKEKAEYFSRLPSIVDQLLNQNEIMRTVIQSREVR